MHSSDCLVIPKCGDVVCRQIRVATRLGMSEDDDESEQMLLYGVEILQISCRHFFRFLAFWGSYPSRICPNVVLMRSDDGEMAIRRAYSFQHAAHSVTIGCGERTELSYRQHHSGLFGDRARTHDCSSSPVVSAAAEALGEVGTPSVDTIWKRHFPTAF